MKLRPTSLRHWVIGLFGLTGLALFPWTIWLSASLKPHHVTRHWDLAWSGFDSGLALAFLLTGTVVVERIFSLPGLGNYFIQASLNRDEPLIIGIVAFIAITLLFMNLLVDIAYAFLDPRVRYN